VGLACRRDKPVPQWKLPDTSVSDRQGAGDAASQSRGIGALAGAVVLLIYSAQRKGPDVRRLGFMQLS
jgi:hypothetical protein